MVLSNISTLEMREGVRNQEKPQITAIHREVLGIIYILKTKGYSDRDIASMIGHTKSYITKIRNDLSYFPILKKNQEKLLTKLITNLADEN